MGLCQTVACNLSKLYKYGVLSVFFLSDYFTDKRGFISVYAMADNGEVRPKVIVIIYNNIVNFTRSYRLLFNDIIKRSYYLFSRPCL